MNDRVVTLSVTQEPAFGAERVLANLVHALPRESMDRWLLLRPDRSGLARWTRDEPIPYQGWPTGRDTTSRNLVAGLRAAHALRGGNIGIVHAWGVRAFEPAVLLAKVLGARVCGTLHDHPDAGFFSRGRRILLRASVPRLRPMVCVSEALARACRDAGLGADLTVIHNGLPPPSSASSAERPRDGAVRVGFFGLYARWKGFETVREWIERADVDLEWHLYGEAAPELRAACAELQAKQLPNVVFHGWVDSAGSMEGIDILIHASLAFDPYPTVLLEAARAGIPAVASDLGGSREIVKHGVTGFLFSPSDPAAGYRHLRTLAAAANLRAGFGATARQRFETEFGVDRMVASYLDLWTP